MIGAWCALALQRCYVRWNSCPPEIGNKKTHLPSFGLWVYVLWNRSSWTLILVEGIKNGNDHNQSAVLQAKSVSDDLQDIFYLLSPFPRYLFHPINRNRHNKIIALHLYAVTYFLKSGVRSSEEMWMSSRKGTPDAAWQHYCFQISWIVIENQFMCRVTAIRETQEYSQHTVMMIVLRRKPCTEPG